MTKAEASKFWKSLSAELEDRMWDVRPKLKDYEAHMLLQKARSYCSGKSDGGVMTLLTPQQDLKYCSNVYLDAWLDNLNILHFGDDLRRDVQHFVVYPVADKGQDRFRFIDIVKRQRKRRA